MGLVKLKKGLESQTPRPVTGNLEVEPMETKIFFRSGPTWIPKFILFLLIQATLSHRHHLLGFLLPTLSYNQRYHTYH